MLSTWTGLKFWTVLSKFKAVADDKLDLVIMMRFGSEMIENIVEKEKMLVISILYFSRNGFRSLFLQGH